MEYMVCMVCFIHGGMFSVFVLWFTAHGSGHGVGHVSQGVRGCRGVVRVRR